MVFESKGLTARVFETKGLKLSKTAENGFGAASRVVWVDEPRSCPNQMLKLLRATGLKSIYFDSRMLCDEKSRGLVQSDFGGFGNQVRCWVREIRNFSIAALIVSHSKAVVSSTTSQRGSSYPPGMEK